MLAVVAFLLLMKAFRYNRRTLADAFAPLEHELHMLQMRSGIHSWRRPVRHICHLAPRRSAICQFCTLTSEGECNLCPKKRTHLAVPHFDVPPWQALQEKVLGTINDFSEENPHVPNALLLTGAGLAYVTFATTRYGRKHFSMCTKTCDPSSSYFNRSSMTNGSTFPRALLATSRTGRKMLEQKWMLLESIREKVNRLVEQEISRLQESEGKPN